MGDLIHFDMHFNDACLLEKVLEGRLVLSYVYNLRGNQYYRRKSQYGVIFFLYRLILMGIFL